MLWGVVGVVEEWREGGRCGIEGGVWEVDVNGEEWQGRSRSREMPKQIPLFAAAKDKPE